jgi:hypothetical protein
VVGLSSVSQEMFKHLELFLDAKLRDDRLCGAFPRRESRGDGVARQINYSWPLLLAQHRSAFANARFNRLDILKPFQSLEI